MTHTDANARIQAEAQKFLAIASKIVRPTTGSIADFMHDMPPKGLNSAMRAIGEAIGNFQDIAMQGADKELLERLRELCEKRVTDSAGHEKTNPYNPTDRLLAVAYPGEDDSTAVQIQELRAAFKHKGRSIFDEMLRMLTDIAVNKKMEIDSGLDDMVGDNRPNKPKNTPPMGWRESLKDDDRPAVDDKSIKDSAAQFDKDKPPVNDNDIKKSAAGENEFRLTDAHRTEYEKTEGKGDAEYLGQLYGEKDELRAYFRLCKALKKAYDETLGTCLEPTGVSPAGKK